MMVMRLPLPTGFSSCIDWLSISVPLFSCEKTSEQYANFKLLNNKGYVCFYFGATVNQPIYWRKSLLINVIIISGAKGVAKWLIEKVNI
jgi:hypothetical protein